MSLINDGEGDLMSRMVSSIIPPNLRKVFKFTHFNAMQAIVARQLLHTNDNMVIAAPTGSGKTVLHELAIMRLLLSFPPSTHPKFKCVFIAPNKALCQQRFQELNFSFGSLGLS